MLDSHHDPELYAAFAAGEVPERELRRRRRRHLEALCRESRHRRRFLALDLLDRVRTRGESRGRCYAAVGLGLLDLAEAFAADAPAVDRELAALRALPSARRASRIQRSRDLLRYRSPLLAEATVEEARGRVRHDARESLDWLAAAGAVVLRAERDVDSPAGSAPLWDLRVRIRSHEGNAHRVLGEVAAAETIFTELRRRITDRAAPALAVSAEVASLEASLRTDQRRLVEAEALLERAARFYGWAEDGLGLAKVLIKRGSILTFAGQAQRAVACHEAALEAVDAETEPQLAFNARHNLALALCACGRHEEARGQNEEAGRLSLRLGDPTNRDHVVWAEGKIAAGLGRDSEALEHLRTARDGYEARGLDFNAALVSLDLAEVHLGRGETAEVKSLAERMARAFEDRGVDSEAMRAVELFARAALAEAVTVGLIARTRSALLRVSPAPAQRDPGAA